MSEVKTRLDRELDTREVTKRPTKWMPPQLLPDPKPEPGYAFRWIRVSSMGKDDATNISGKFREGCVEFVAEFSCDDVCIVDVYQLRPEFARDDQDFRLRARDMICPDSGDFICIDQLTSLDSVLKCDLVSLLFCQSSLFDQQIGRLWVRVRSKFV